MHLHQVSAFAYNCTIKVRACAISFSVLLPALAGGMGHNRPLALQWHKNCETKNCFADFLNRA